MVENDAEIESLLVGAGLSTVPTESADTSGDLLLEVDGDIEELPWSMTTTETPTGTS